MSLYFFLYFLLHRYKDHWYSHILMKKSVHLNSTKIVGHPFVGWRHQVYHERSGLDWIQVSPTKRSRSWSRGKPSADLKTSFRGWHPISRIQIQPNMTTWANIQFFFNFYGTRRYTICRQLRLCLHTYFMRVSINKVNVKL